MLSNSHWRSVAQLFAVLVLAMVLPAWFCRVFDEPAKMLESERRHTQFDPAYERRALQRIKPSWVLIGNSMLNTRIDNVELSKASGSKARKVSKGGSQSALWFLFFKNVVIESGVRPALVTVFFRETDLTLPYFRVEGLNETLNAELHGFDEPEWQQVMMKKSEPGEILIGWIRDGLSVLFPSKELRPTARKQMQYRAFRATRGDGGINSNVRRMELNARFSLAHLRHDLGSDFASATTGPSGLEGGANSQDEDTGSYENGPDVFDDSTDTSFLPHFISLAKKHGIRLHFHRVKRRPSADNASRDTSKMQTYMKDLGTYLDANGCLLTDESQDLRLTLDMYADGDHISADEAIQKRYLANFWERVAPIVKPVLQTKIKPSN